MNNFKSFHDYLTEAANGVVFTFGRFNPPTVGHEKLLEVLAKSAKGGDVYRVYASQSQDKKKNPLGYNDKVKFMRKMFPKHARSIINDKGVKTALDVLVKLYADGFTQVSMVVGSDRVNEFDALANKYNGVDARHGFYNFEGGVNIISAGERDPDSEGVSGMSASKMRAAAEGNDFELFKKGLPTSFKDGQKLFNAVRSGMDLKESYTYRKHIQLESVSTIREDYINGDLFDVGDLVVVKESDEVGTVSHLGTNYVILKTTDGKSLRKWIDNVEKIS
jgi:hypothetical protein|tara:strand:+ start:1720 stop:2550 length:831 start_codon:yes stop_codon:yes gene_type:complete